MGRLLRTLRKMGAVTGYALFRADAWVERVIVGAALIAMAILSLVIALGIIEGKYSIVSPYRF